MVVALIALFVSLGGVGYAAISGSSLRDRSVPGKKLERRAVGTVELALGAVTGGRVARDTLTGDDVRESSLGRVPSAATVGDLRAARVDYRAHSSDPPQVALRIGGLTLRGDCNPTLNPLASDIAVIAGTSVANSEIQVAYNKSDGNASGSGDRYVADNNFDPGDRFDIFEGADDVGQGMLTYSTPTGRHVTVVFQSDDVSVLGGEYGCLLGGTALYSPR
jgi:hypothetical protein